MAAPRKSDAHDPRFAEVLFLHEPSWVPVFLGRATLGCPSVVVVDVAPAGVGSVALLSATEASAWLKGRGDAKSAARVSGTATPGAAWAVGVSEAGTTVWPLAMGPILARPHGVPTAG